jgi:hypothetical protein
MLPKSELAQSKSAVVEAAYVDILNVVSAAILTYPVSALAKVPEQMLVLICGKNTWELLQEMMQKICRPSLSMNISLLNVAILKRVTYATAIRRDHLALQNTLLFAQSLGHDVVLEALKCAVAAWSSRKEAEDILGLCRGFIRLLSNSPSQDLVALGLTSIAETLNRRPQGSNWIIESLQSEFAILDPPL